MKGSLVPYFNEFMNLQAFKDVLKGNSNTQSRGEVVLDGKVMIGEITFEVLEGDITKETSDCIVNGTNNNLDFRVGMCGLR